MHTRSMGLMSCCFMAAAWSGLSRRASRPPWILGCSVLTRPSIISGKPVTSETSVTGNPRSRRSFAGRRRGVDHRVGEIGGEDAVLRALGGEADLAGGLVGGHDPVVAAAEVDVLRVLAEHLDRVANAPLDRAVEGPVGLVDRDDALPA